MNFVRSPGLPRGFAFRPDSLHPVVLRPLGPVSGDAARECIEQGVAWPLAGGPLAFVAVEAFFDGEDGVRIVAAPVADIQEWAEREGGVAAEAVAASRGALSAARPPFAGLYLDRPVVMGVVNVTPDSFHDGGLFADPDAAIEQGLALVEAGADLIDVGGESTRPGAEPVSEEEELARIIPVIEALSGRHVKVSVDTRRADVMEVALARGASVVNDVCALSGPGAVETVAGSEASVVLMHMRGTPGTMQNEPHYGHAPYEVFAYLASRKEACLEAGIDPARIAVDPGIGFGKTDAHNLQLLSSLAMFQGLGCALAIGVSRKSLIGRLAHVASTEDRLSGTVALTAAAAFQAAHIHRVHDVAEARQALALIDALART